MSARFIFFASIVAAILIFLTFVGTVFCYFVAPEFLVPINNFDAKLYVLLVIELLLLLISLHISVFFFFPSAIRDARSNVLTCRIGLFASLVSPLALFGLQQVVVADGSWSISFEGATGAVVLSMAVSYFALYKFSNRYQELSKPKNLSWASRHP